MNMQQVLEILKLVLTLAIGALVIYYQNSARAQERAAMIQGVIGNITSQANKFIAEAEAKYKDTTNMGGVKFTEVVDKLHALVPEVLKDFITKEMIGTIVQKAFDEIEEYVALQLDKAINKIGEE